MNIQKLSNSINKEEYLQSINVSKEAINILKNKMDINLFLIKNINVIAANILKQDALSIGADVATPKNTITHRDKFVDVILIANNKQLKILSSKEKAQPFGLKDFAQEIKHFLKTKNYQNKIMGIINANNDSFFDGSRFLEVNAIEKIEEMISDGADIIDIGAVSSRPFSTPVSTQEEMDRIKPIIDAIYQKKLYEKVLFSADTYKSEIAQYALGKGFHIINDITSLSDKNMAKIVSQHNASIILMHMQGNTQNMQINPTYENIISDIEKFFLEKIQIAKKHNIRDIILDIGIGFGKTLKHNISLIKNLSHFKHLGYELLIGASRKSLINDIIKTDVKDRLAGTLSIHQKALDNGANIIRCHDVKEHIQMLKLYEQIK